MHLSEQTCLKYQDKQTYRQQCELQSLRWRCCTDKVLMVATNAFKTTATRTLLNCFTKRVPRETWRSAAHGLDLSARPAHTKAVTINEGSQYKASDFL